MTSSSCRHGCFTEEIPEELEYILAKEQMARCDFKLQIAECFSTQAAKPEARKQGIQIKC